LATEPTDTVVAESSSENNLLTMSTQAGKHAKAKAKKGKAKSSSKKGSKKGAKGSKQGAKKGDFGAQQAAQQKKVVKADAKKLHTVATKQETIKEHSAISAVRQGIYGNEPSPLNKARHKAAKVGDAAAAAVYKAAKKAHAERVGKKAAKRKAAERAKKKKEALENAARRHKWAAEAKAEADEKKQKKRDAYYMKRVINDENKRRHKKEHKKAHHMHKDTMGEVNVSAQVAKNKLGRGAEATRVKDDVNDPPQGKTTYNTHFKTAPTPKPKTAAHPAKSDMDEDEE